MSDDNADLITGICSIISMTHKEIIDKQETVANHPTKFIPGSMPDDSAAFCLFDHGFVIV